MEYQYPLAEPGYSGKRTLALTPFEKELTELSAARSALLDGLLGAATLLDLARMMAQGELTAAELVAYYVARIRRHDVGKLNAVMELNPQAPAIARELDAEQAHSPRGPLHGIPLLIKDNIATGDGMHATTGTWALRAWQPAPPRCVPGGAAAQSRGRNPGKANLSEWANYMDTSMPNGFSVLGGQGAARAARLILRGRAAARPWPWRRTWPQWQWEVKRKGRLSCPRWLTRWWGSR